MATKIKKCPAWHYTMKNTCNCGLAAKSAHPPKFSEKFAKYRTAKK